MRLPLLFLALILAPLRARTSGLRTRAGDRTGLSVTAPEFLSNPA